MSWFNCLILNHRDSKFRCRAYLPSNAKSPFRWRYVEGRQSVLRLRRYAIVVESVPVQDLQIVKYVFKKNKLLTTVTSDRSWKLSQLHTSIITMSKVGPFSWFPRIISRQNRFHSVLSNLLIIESWMIIVVILTKLADRLLSALHLLLHAGSLFLTWLEFNRK